jgi:hypothetical protein
VEVGMVFMALKLMRGLMIPLLYDANNAADGARVIWVKPPITGLSHLENLVCVYPILNSIADTNLMNLFFRDFVWLHADIRENDEKLERENRSLYNRIVSCTASR